MILSIGRLQDIGPVEGQFSKVVIGPLKVVTEIFCGFNPVINCEPNRLYLHYLRSGPVYDLAELPRAAVVATTRIGLNPAADRSADREYYNRQYRYLIYPTLPHKNKTGIAEALYRAHGASPEHLSLVRQQMRGEYLKHHYPK